MLDLRDVGWDATGGALAGTAWLAWRGWRRPPFRRPLAVAAATGMLLWSAGMLFTGAGDAATMPPTVLSTLEGDQPVDLRTAAAGRPVVVNLWASCCGPCRQEMPTLAEAQRHFTDFADFEQRMMWPTFADHLIDDAKLVEVRAVFEPRMKAGGAHFTRPMHVRVLRRLS